MVEKFKPKLSVAEKTALKPAAQNALLHARQLVHEAENASSYEEGWRATGAHGPFTCTVELMNNVKEILREHPELEEHLDFPESIKHHLK